MTLRESTPTNASINFNTLQEEIISSVKAGRPLLGQGGVLTPLIKLALEAALEGEMTAHITTGSEAGIRNRRNGKSAKEMRSASGSFELLTPRDRNSSFEPEIIKKRQTVLGESLDNRILELFATGMSYQDISDHLKEMYDFEASPATISAVTDKLLPVIAEWRSRPLEAVYPIVFLDAMYFKARADGKVVTKVIYNILGIDKEGRKDILGFYVAESEGAHFWLSVLNDLRERGVKDILIACIDGLKGFPEAINTLFPQTEIQLCIVHQIRNSLKYIASKDQKEFMLDLKTVYRAPSKDVAEHQLLELERKWGKKYPAVIASWENNWEHLSNYFKFSSEIRKLIYTTNAIEGFHRQVRKYTKTKGAFTSENALFKLVYCAIQKIGKKWTQPLQNWALTVSQLRIYFGERMPVELN
jgi:transposase-like protein